MENLNKNYKRTWGIESFYTLKKTLITVYYFFNRKPLAWFEVKNYPCFDNFYVPSKTRFIVTINLTNHAKFKKICGK